MTKKTFILILIPSIIVMIIGIAWWYSTSREIRIRNKVIAQNQVCINYFDKMWKIINEQAQVSSQYKQAFKDIYPAIMKEGFGNDNGQTLFKWISGFNPKFDISLYSALMKTIESERIGFFREQKSLTDLVREHSDFRQTPPTSFFVGNRPDVPIVYITSDKTNEALKTGVDNDVNLFKKD